MVIIGLGGVKFFAKVLKIDKKVIVPAVLAFSLIGAYSARNSMFDVLVAIVFGVAGLVCKRAKIPVAPIILGMILGTMAEENLRRAMTIASAKSLSLVGYIVMRPGFAGRAGAGCAADCGQRLFKLQTAQGEKLSRETVDIPPIFAYNECDIRR